MIDRLLVYSATKCNVFFWLQDYNVALVVLSGEDHALGFDTHHLASLKVKNEGAFFAHEILGFVPLQKSRNGLSLFSPKINYHSYEVSRAWDLVSFHYFSDAEIELLKFIKGNFQF